MAIARDGPPRPARRVGGRRARWVAGDKTKGAPPRGAAEPFHRYKSGSSDRGSDDGLRLGSLRLGGFDVDAALGELGQELVGLAFLVEGLLEQLGRLVVADELGPGADRAVAGDL